MPPYISAHAGLMTTHLLCGLVDADGRTGAVLLAAATADEPGRGRDVHPITRWRQLHRKKLVIVTLQHQLFQVLQQLRLALRTTQSIHGSVSGCKSICPSDTTPCRHIKSDTTR